MARNRSYIKLNKLYAFKNHLFEVWNDEEMWPMVSSVKDKALPNPLSSVPVRMAAMRSCQATAARRPASLPDMWICPVSSAI